jgi:hypothetical protein
MWAKLLVEWLEQRKGLPGGAFGGGIVDESWASSDVMG